MTINEHKNQMVELFEKDTHFATQISADPQSRTAHEVRELFLRTEAKENGMLPTLLKELNLLGSFTLFTEENPEESKVAKIISLVYTLLTENKTDELHNAIAISFPEFFDDTEVPNSVIIPAEKFKKLEQVAGF